MTLQTLVLLVEDSPSDADLTRAVLLREGLAGAVEIAEDGETGLAFLRREAPFEAARRPALVLLDLDLPMQHGDDVLHQIKSDPALHEVPVVVLTGSQTDADVANSWEHEADGYIVKPVTAGQLRVAMRIIAKRGVRGGASRR